MNGIEAFDIRNGGTDLRNGSPATNLQNYSAPKATPKTDHFVYWVGEDGNIWVNQNGNTFNAGKPKTPYALRNDGFVAENLALSGGTKIDNPNPSGQGSASNGGNAGGSTGGYDAYTAQLNAEKARRKGEAQGIKDSMAGKRGEFADILNQILGNIDTTFSEEVTKLDETRDNDKAELIEALADAIPEIGNSFAAIGAYDSSQRAGRNADTREEEKKAEEEIDKEYEDNKANLGNKANEARNNARNAYNNFMIDFDTLDQTEANSDTLETLRQSQNSLLKGLSDFGSQREAYKPGSTFANEISALNKYNGTKAKDAFSNFLNSAGASGIKANSGAGNSANAIKNNSNKKNTETELEVNQKTGVK